MEPFLSRPQAARLVQTLRERFWPGLRYVVGRDGCGKTDLLRQAYFLQARDSGGPVPVWLRPGTSPEGEQFAAQLLEFRAGRLQTPFVTLDQDLLKTQPDETLLLEVLVSAGNNNPEKFFAALGRWMSRTENLPVCLYLDDAPEEWLTTSGAMFGLPVAILASGQAERAPRHAEMIRLEDFSTREAVLLGEVVARQVGIDYRGAAAEGFCAHVGRNAQTISTTVKTAAHIARPLLTEADFAAAFLEDSLTDAERALQHAALVANFATARRREEQARINASMAASLAKLTPAFETWLMEQGIAGVRIPVVTSVAWEELPGGTLLLAFGGGVFGGQEMLAAALLEPAGEGNYAAALTKFRNRIAALAPPPVTLFDPRWEHVERWVIFRQPPDEAGTLAETAGARLMPLGIFQRLISGQAMPEAFRDELETVLRLPLEKDFEIPAVHALDHLLERRQLEGRSATQIRMALVEACVNAIEHGRAASPEEAFIEVRLAVGQDQVRITVINPGLPKSHLGSSLLRGHGRKILNSLMDTVHYEGDLNHTRVVLTKRIGMSGDMAGADHEQAPTGGQRS